MTTDASGRHDADQAGQKGFTVAPAAITDPGAATSTPRVRPPLPVINPAALVPEVIGDARLATALRGFMDAFNPLLAELAQHHDQVTARLGQTGRSYQQGDDDTAETLGTGRASDGAPLRSAPARPTEAAG